MKLVLQRVKTAQVNVDGKEISRINKGLLILVGVETGDTMEDVEWVSKKSAALRIFSDSEGKMNLSVIDVDGEILAVSQFTLLASTKKGNRPSYIAAAPPSEAENLYDEFCKSLTNITAKEVKRGIFGADMQVKLINDGPVTIILDSRETK